MINIYLIHKYIKFIIKNSKIELNLKTLSEDLN